MTAPMTDPAELVRGDLETRIAGLEMLVDELQSIIRAQPRTVFMQDVVRWRLAKDLPELMAKYPNGVTAEHVSEKYGFPKGSVLISIKKMERAGKIQYLTRRHTHEKIVLPIGAPVPPLGMTKTRQRVYDALIEMAKNGEVRGSHKTIALKVGSHPSTVNYVINCLIRDRQLQLVQRGDGFSPSIYRLWTRPDRQTQVVTGHLMGDPTEARLALHPRKA